MKVGSYQFIAPLNALRFFAALSIVVFHFGRWSFPFDIEYLNKYVLLSNTGVTLFFVLSGFIMVHVYGNKFDKKLEKKESLSFYKARLARILPVYFLALLITFLYFIYAKEVWTFKSLFLQVLFLQSWFPHESLNLNFPGWSLSTEMFFYFLFPFLMFYFSKTSNKKRLLIVSLFWFISNFFTVFLFFKLGATEEVSNIFLKFFPLLHLNSFLIGIFSGIYYQDIKNSFSKLLFFLAILLLFLNPLFIDNKFNVIQHNGFLAPLFAVIILGIASSKKYLAKIFSWKPLVIGGDISYGIYILHAPVYWLVYEIFRFTNIYDLLGESFRFFSYLVILIIFTLFIKYFFEDPLKQLINVKKYKNRLFS